MVVGFNHNFRYKGVLYHIQTEDGGVRHPVLITHLFNGGTILATKKTSYADILKSDRLEQVVEELMKEQHKEMLRRLRGGELDQLIARSSAKAAESAGRPPAPEPFPAPPAAAPPAPATAADTAVASAPAAAESAASAAGKATELADRVLEQSLDDIILSYLLGEEKSD